MMRVLTVLLMLILVSTSVVALDNTVEIELFPDGTAREKLDVSFIASEDASEIVYSLNNFPDNLVILERNQQLYFQIYENGLYEIVIDRSVRKGERVELQLEFFIDGLVDKSDDKNIFSFRFTPDSNIENFGLMLELPRGYVLADIETATSPTPSSLDSDGRNIMLAWKLNDVDDEQSFIVVYEKGISSSLGLGIGITIIVAILVIGGVILFYRREKREIVDGVLSSEEKKIVEIIANNKEMTQKQIVKDTGFSKSKISKIIRRLEEKGIVEKTPWMATNKLKIKNKIKR